MAFVVMSFPLRGGACVDDPDSAVALGETDEQQPLLRRVADDDLPLFASRVVRVVEDPGQRIHEYGERFLEADTVSPGVGVRLHGLPFEIDAHRHRSRRYHDAIRRTAVPTRFQRPVSGPAERVDSIMFTADGA